MFLFSDSNQIFYLSTPSHLHAQLKKDINKCQTNTNKRSSCTGSRDQKWIRCQNICGLSLLVLGHLWHNLTAAFFLRSQGACTWHRGPLCPSGVTGQAIWPHTLHDRLMVNKPPLRDIFVPPVLLKWQAMKRQERISGRSFWVHNGVWFFGLRI